jgi:hypothetical protein
MDKSDDLLKVLREVTIVHGNKPASALQGRKVINSYPVVRLYLG